MFPERKEPTTGFGGLQPSSPLRAQGSPRPPPLGLPPHGVWRAEGDRSDTPRLRPYASHDLGRAVLALRLVFAGSAWKPIAPRNPESASPLGGGAGLHPQPGLSADLRAFLAPRPLCWREGRPALPGRRFTRSDRFLFRRPLAPWVWKGDA